MLKDNDTFTLNSVTSCIRMQCQADGTPNAVLGVVRCRPTKDRDQPPDCGNGYETERLAFAKGHLMALELGGVDDKWNVVPQFEHWQGKPNGAWRQMEIGLRKQLATTIGAAMLVEVTYGRGGAQEAHAVALAAFEANRLRAWTDPRIPDYFRVRVWTGGPDGLVQGITDDTTFSNAVTKLKMLTTVYDSQDLFRLGNDMPEPDRSMYEVQEAITQGLEMQVELKRDGSFASFILEQGTIPKLRQRLVKQKKMRKTSAQGMQALPLLKDYQGITGPQLKKKVLKRKHDELSVPTVDEVGVDYLEQKKKKLKT